MKDRAHGDEMARLARRPELAARIAAVMGAAPDSDAQSPDARDCLWFRHLGKVLALPFPARVRRGADDCGRGERVQVQALVAHDELNGALAKVKHGKRKRELALFRLEAIGRQSENALWLDAYRLWRDGIIDEAIDGVRRNSGGFGTPHPDDLLNNISLESPRADAPPFDPWDNLPFPPLPSDYFDDPGEADADAPPLPLSRAKLEPAIPPSPKRPKEPEPLAAAAPEPPVGDPSIATPAEGSAEPDAAVAPAITEPPPAAAAPALATAESAATGSGETPPSPPAGPLLDEVARPDPPPSPDAPATPGREVLAPATAFDPEASSETAATLSPDVATMASGIPGASPEAADPEPPAIHAGSGDKTTGATAPCLPTPESTADSFSVALAELERLHREREAEVAELRHALEEQQHQAAAARHREAERLRADLAGANAELDALRLRVKELEEEARTFCDLADDAKRDRDFHIAEHRKLQVRAESLAAQLAARNGRPEGGAYPLPDTYDAVPAWVEEHLAGRLLLLPRALRGLAEAQFHNVGLVCRALLLLANEYRSMKKGDLPREAFEAGLEDLRLRCSQSITHVRAGEEGDEYFVPYPPGTLQRRFLEMHLRNNSGTRYPPRCLAIYFLWDGTLEQVAVGWLPGHLDIRSSN